MRTRAMHVLAALLVSGLAVRATEAPRSRAPLPLPDAPVRLVIQIGRAHV